MASIYTNFEGGARQNAQFFGRNFPKHAQKHNFWPVFQNFACGAEILVKTGFL